MLLVERNSPGSPDKDRWEVQARGSWFLFQKRRLLEERPPCLHSTRTHRAYRVVAYQFPLRSALWKLTGWAVKACTIPEGPRVARRYATIADRLPFLQVDGETDACTAESADMFHLQLEPPARGAVGGGYPLQTGRGYNNSTPNETRNQTPLLGHYGPG